MPEQFSGALGALAGGRTIGDAGAFAPAPPVIDRIGGSPGNRSRAVMRAVGAWRQMG
jgi:hypothetical protein